MGKGAFSRGKCQGHLKTSELFLRSPPTSNYGNVEWSGTFGRSRRINFAAPPESQWTKPVSSSIEHSGLKKNIAKKSAKLHSSEIRGLSSTKCSSETLQNLLYFMYLMNALVYVDIDQGIHKVKI